MNHLIFAAIISHFKLGEKSGELKIQIRGNGVLKKTWDDLKNVNQIVRTSDGFGSAGKI